MNTPLPQIPGTALLELQESLPGVENKILLLQATTTFGRHPSNNIAIPRNTISRFHARIRRDGLKYYMEDLGSSNGSFVNGKPVTHQELKDKDLLTLGDVDFHFQVGEKAPQVRARGKDDSDIRLEMHTLPRNEAGETMGLVEATPARNVNEAIRQISTDEPGKNVAQYLRTHYRMLEIIRNQRREDRVIKDFLELTFEVLKARRAVVLLYEDSGDTMVPVAVCLAPQFQTNEDIPLSRTIIDLCVDKQRSLLSRDIPHDPRFSSSDSVLSLGLLSVICVPMIDSRGVFGVCYLDSDQETDAFSEEDLHFATNLTEQLSLAVENLRMSQQQEHERQMVVMGQTISEISHSIKNILSMTQTGSELMDHHLADKNIEGATRTWGTIHQGLDRINKIVREMLDFSRQVEHDLSEVDLAEVARALHAEWSEEMTQSEISLQVHCHGSAAPCLLEPDLLRDAVTNLLVNARDAVENTEHPEISIEVRSTDSRHSEISVCDNGPGIPREIQDRVFRPFFSTKREKGNGMGLAMVSKFVHEMGGQCLLDSEAGKGTRVRIVFPAMEISSHSSANQTFPPFQL